MAPQSHARCGQDARAPGHFMVSGCASAGGHERLVCALAGILTSETTEPGVAAALLHIGKPAAKQEQREARSCTPWSLAGGAFLRSLRNIDLVTTARMLSVGFHLPNSTGLI
ncbi:hypothetical protein SBA2_320006 [Acidobacteriia bacterium SbA2]|nr:hypothetical protein SBA2_320006 [Acidobacteriia bacterium SbA2]